MKTILKYNKLLQQAILKGTALRRFLLGGLLCATLGWMALLMALAAWQEPKTPDLGSAVTPASKEYLGHLVLYGVLGALTSYDIYYLKGRRRPWLAVLAAVLIGTAWGVATESYQAYVPGRDASPTDVLTNAMGAICGGVVAALLCRMAKLPTYHP